MHISGKFGEIPTNGLEDNALTN